MIYDVLIAPFVIASLGMGLFICALLSKTVTCSLPEAVLLVEFAGDERRNYYRITAFGMSVARAETRRMEALVRAARYSGLAEKPA